MATIKIEPISTVSKGNHKVIITGIRPTWEDSIVGQYWNGQDGPHDAGWNSSGIMRGGVDDFNLDVGSTEEITDLVATIKQLGGR